MAGNCSDPLGKTYIANGTEIYFNQAFGPEDGIVMITMGGVSSCFPYIFNQETCSVEIRSTPTYWLFLDGDWIVFSSTPRFVLKVDEE